MQISSEIDGAPFPAYSRCRQAGKYQRSCNQQTATNMLPLLVRNPKSGHLKSRRTPGPTREPPPRQCNSAELQAPDGPPGRRDNNVAPSRAARASTHGPRDEATAMSRRPGCHWQAIQTGARDDATTMSRRLRARDDATQCHAIPESACCPSWKNKGGGNN